MVQAVNQPEGLSLTTHVDAPTTPLGKALHTILQRMQQALAVIHQSVDHIRNISTQITKCARSLGVEPGVESADAAGVLIPCRRLRE